MFGNNFFDRREVGYNERELQNHVGAPGHGNQRFINPIQPFQTENWNGLSPRNKENQAHYQRVRESPPVYENDGGQDSEAEVPPITRKRLGSPQLADHYPSKRAKGYDESFTRQRQQAPPSVERNTSFNPGRYSDAEFQIPLPPNTNTGSSHSRWMGPEISDGDRWGSTEGAGFGNMLPSPAARYSNNLQQKNYGVSQLHYSPATFGGYGGGIEPQRRQIDISDAFNDSPFHRRGGTYLDTFQESPDQKRDITGMRNRRAYQGQQILDLTTPESVRPQKTAVISSANSGSTMRRAAETEPTDFENDWDSDLQDYKSAKLRSYITTDSFEHQNYNRSNSYSGQRSQIILPGSGKSRPSQPRQSFKNENHANSAFCSNPSRQQFFENPIARQFSQAPETENAYGHVSSYRDPQRENDLNQFHPKCDAYRQSAIRDDTPSDGNDTTIEFKIKASTFGKKRNSAGKRPSASGHSSQDIEKSLRAREEDCGNSLSRIRAPEPSFNADNIRRVVLNQTAAQRTATSEKEKVEALRQRRALESIAQKEKEAKELQGAIGLFEESPIDQAAQARIKEANDLEKARKQIREEAKIVEEGHKLVQEKIGAFRKGVTAQDKEEENLAKKERRDANRQGQEKRERERLDAKRKSADQIRRVKQVQDEEARLKRLDAQKQANKMSAASLQPVKRTAAKPNLAGKAQIEVEVAEESGNVSDGGMFVFVDDDSVEEPREQPYTVGADKDVADELALSQELGVFMVKPASAEEPKTAAESNETANTEKPEAFLAGEKVMCMENPETPLKNTELAGEQKPETVNDQPEPQSSAAPSTAQKPETAVDREKSLLATAASAAEKPTIAVNTTLDVGNMTVQSLENIRGPFAAVKPTSADNWPLNAENTVLRVVEKTQMPISAVKQTSSDNTLQNLTNTAVLGEKEPPVPVSTAEQSRPLANTSDTAVSSENKDSTPRASTGAVSISAVASDGRRRPPEASRRRVTQQTSTDPSHFTSGGRASQNTRKPSRDATSATPNTPAATYHPLKRPQNKNADKEANDTQAKLLKTLGEVEELKNKANAEEELRKKEWDARILLLDAARNPQDLQDVFTGRQQGGLGKNRPAPPIVGNDNRASSSASHAKPPSYLSKIEFVSNVESQSKERKKSEQDRLAKYEKDKIIRRKRYDKAIRVVLTGQGVEPDEGKISKQVDEKMTVWDENRRKKENRESGGKDLFGSISHRDNQGTAHTEKDLNSPPNLPNSDDEGPKDPQAAEKQERAQAIRAGVEFLATQNRAGNSFAAAASKFRIQDFDSDESEEDPDDESDTHAASVRQTRIESSEEMADTEMDETLNPASLDNSIIPLLPQVPESPRSKTAFLPDIVNPREQDIMHSYSVRHRAERENKNYESMIIGSFHSLEEANAFAQLKTSEFSLGPSTGKSETHTDENLYVGQVTTNKEMDHREIVWVTREIVYIGDTANVRRGDIKTLIVPKVFNVMQVLHGEDDTHIGSIVATTSIKTLANKKAVDHFLALSRPSRPRLDSMAQYNDEVVPLAQQQMAEAEAQDATLELEGFIPDTERTFTMSISENPVLGPLN